MGQERRDDGEGAELDVRESPMPDDGGRWNLCAWCHGHAGVGVSLGHLGDL
jgi:hypothetical protein